MYADETRPSTVASPCLEITPGQALLNKPIRIRVLQCTPQHSNSSEIKGGSHP
jgi:hypothetical protein